MGRRKSKPGTTEPRARRARSAKRASRPAPPRRRRKRPSVAAGGGETTELLGVLESHRESGPPLTGGDLDADWQRAGSSGEEAVGGSVATPDQDVVDEIGRALGVEQPLDAPVRPSADLLRDRDRGYWRLERRAVGREEAAESGAFEGEEGETP